jgi:hypothetical protein
MTARADTGSEITLVARREADTQHINNTIYMDWLMSADPN